MNKTCVRCKELKSLEEFEKSKKSNDGLLNTCKKCRKEIKARSYRKKYDKEKIALINKERKEAKSNWYKDDKRNDPEKYKKKWNEQNKNRTEIKKMWYQENKSRICKEINKKRKSNVKEKINHNISNSIRKSIIRNKGGYSWESLVGYDINTLIEHLKNNVQDGFAFDDYLSSDLLHIDHIIPVNFYSFESFNDKDFKKCWNFRNLRLIYKKDNLSKGRTIDKRLIIEYDITDLLPEGVNINDV
jgi:hypothetical protein